MGVDFVSTREWRETNEEGNYSSSTITGLNSRRHHGLFVVRDPDSGEMYVILSHLQEEIYADGNCYKLYCAEYKNHEAMEGLKWLNSFDLDPFPRYIYQFPDFIVTKSIAFLKDRSQLIIVYEFSGLVPAASRFVIRPFFAFRSIHESTIPDRIENTEVFLMEKQFRYLPYRDALEIFMQHSEGHFTNSPTWYHNFVYRSEPENTVEDLLNPGFFEISIQVTRPVMLSIGLQSGLIEDTEKQFIKERERRSTFLHPAENREEKVNYLFGKQQDFLREHNRNIHFYTTDLLESDFNLSFHCMIICKLLRSGIQPNQASKYIQDLISLLHKNGLSELFSGMNPTVRIDAATPFLIVFLLYYYHTIYQKDDMLDAIVSITTEIIYLIRKNKLPFYILKRNKLLERQYRKSDMSPHHVYEIFYPLRQNFIVNVFWCNILSMAVYLGEIKDIRFSRYIRWIKRIRQRFYQQYVKPFISNPSRAVTDFGFAFHPSMIYCITLPFPILDEKVSQILYRLLLKQFLTKDGIKFPVRWDNYDGHVISPILMGEYFDGWEKLMKEKEFLYTFFHSVSKRFDKAMKENIIGYIPNILAAMEVKLPQSSSRPSGVAHAEVIYFSHRLAEVGKRVKE
jgi:hypothetical protein